MFLNYQDLLHPEFLTEWTLREILKSKCIDTSNIFNMEKADLIEMFKRVALPMPQRQCNEGRPLGKKLNDLRISRNIDIATSEEHILYEWSRKKPMQCLEDSTPKKMHFSNCRFETTGSLENDAKRKINKQEVTAQTEISKRQKISWP
ncbi:PREDICTED: uncharacterized protein LOC105363519 isoform X2 [Ceratosolen solmsi marchali]|uniref:Ashwin n=1 Tax=Ceratosolen solmsi marchali TaxID=326594 RepID=A0AAJ6YK61_9HYME|nr:PREDICTED: uncharacterized protein LOC105363519 isoform X2 [Ceratosolen solmsi marchali]